MNIRLSQKRTCNGCRACVSEWSCEFGYKVAPKGTIAGRIYMWKPLEPCYKPKTMSEYLLAKELTEK